MKLKEFLEQLNELAKERPEALEMEVKKSNNDDWRPQKVIGVDITFGDVLIY